MDPRLSICIPTYERADYLRDALESIRAQLTEESAAAVEVVVADNASADRTEAVAREYAGRFRHFVYIKNPANVGFDRNVDIAVRAARGEYCWYLGDDDMIVGGAIAHILELCRSGRYALITVPDRPLADRRAALEERESYGPADHQETGSADEFYRRGHLASALSMLIFRRREWLEAADLSDHTPGWFYYEPVMKLAAETEGRLLRVTKPMVLTGQDMRWADGGAGLKIFIDCQRFLRKMPGWGYDEAVAARELAGNARQFPRVLLQAKARGLPVSRQSRALMRSFTSRAPLPTRLLSELLFFLPNPLVRLIRDLKKILSKA